MKLRNLNGLIRKNEGSVKLRFATAHGSLIVGLVKSELLAALADLFPDASSETNLTLDNGRLMHDGVEDASLVHGTLAVALYDEPTPLPYARDLDPAADVDELDALLACSTEPAQALRFEDAAVSELDDLLA